MPWLTLRCARRTARTKPRNNSKRDAVRLGTGVWLATLMTLEEHIENMRFNDDIIGLRRFITEKFHGDDEVLALACSAYLAAYAERYGTQMDERIGQFEMVRRDLGVPAYDAAGPTLWEAVQWLTQASELMRKTLGDCLANSPLDPFQRGNAIKHAMQTYDRAKLWAQGKDDGSDDVIMERDVLSR